MKSILEETTQRHAMDYSATLTFEEAFLPYQLKLLENEMECILLNRYYLPVGERPDCDGSPITDYSRHPARMPFCPTVERIVEWGLSNAGYFYSAVNRPSLGDAEWERYCLLLRRVMKELRWAIGHDDRRGAIYVRQEAL